MNVPLSKPDIGEREISYVMRVLRTGQLSLGPWVGEFEQRFADYVGTRYAVATNSGTSALHLCVRALGIGPGDEVLTSSFSFVASANCVLYERALPSFVDIDPVTLNIDPNEIQRFIEERCVVDSELRVLIDKRTGRSVKAILPVHVFGYPCDMDPICELARRYHLRIIEDACEALGAEYRRRRVGTFGDMAVFAFYPNKQMTTAEGGMIVTNDECLARLCRSMRNQGRDTDAGWLRHARLGFNYRLSDLHCALGLAQLERLDALLSERESVAGAYGRALAGHPHLELPHRSFDLKRSWFVYVVKILASPPQLVRDRVIARLRKQGVGCQAYFPAIHLQPYFRPYSAPVSDPLPNTESASDCCLALPFYTGLTEPQVSHVCAALSETLEMESAGVASEMPGSGAVRTRRLVPVEGQA